MMNFSSSKGFLIFFIHRGSSTHAGIQGRDMKQRIFCDMLELSSQNLTFIVKPSKAPPTPPQVKVWIGHCHGIAFQLYCDSLCIWDVKKTYSIENPQQTSEFIDNLRKSSIGIDRTTFGNVELKIGQPKVFQRSWLLFVGGQQIHGHQLRLKARLQ